MSPITLVLKKDKSVFSCLQNKNHIQPNTVLNIVGLENKSLEKKN